MVILKLISFILFLFVFIKGNEVDAKNEKKRGIGFEGAIGKPAAFIENPDDTIAYYDGISLMGRAHIPIFETKRFHLNFTGSIRYMDFKNNKNSSEQKEIGQHIGPGLGLELKLFRILLGMESHFILARHYSIGSYSEELKFNMPIQSFYYGFIYDFGQLSVSLTMSQSSGKVPRSETFFDEDSPFSDTTYWLQLKYSTGYSITEFVRALFY